MLHGARSPSRGANQEGDRSTTARIDQVPAWPPATEIEFEYADELIAELPEPATLPMADGLPPSDAEGEPTPAPRSPFDKLTAGPVIFTWA